MTKSNQTVEIRLLGQKIVLKASESDPVLLREVVELVSTKIRQAEKRIKTSAPHQVTLIALLELAEEYVKAKQRTIDFKRQVGDKSEALLDIIDSELK